MISQLLVLSDFITSFLLRDHLCFHSTFSDHSHAKVAGAVDKMICRCTA